LVEKKSTSEETPMSTDTKQPASLGTYSVPHEREELIKQHIAMLSETARSVSDQLAFAADISDLTRTLEANSDDAAEDSKGAQ